MWSCCPWPVFPKCGFSISFHPGPRFLWASRSAKILRAEIYRAGAMVIGNPVFKETADLVLGAVKQAGREIIENGSVAAATTDQIIQPLLENKDMAVMANIFWRECIREGITPKDFSKLGRPPRPDDMESFLTLMEVAFNGQAAADLVAVMRFDFSGEVEGTCHLKIDRGRIEAVCGECESADLKINTPFEGWMDVITGQIAGPQLFADQKATAEGDMSLLMAHGGIVRQEELTNNQNELRF